VQVLSPDNLVLLRCQSRTMVGLPEVLESRRRLVSVRVVRPTLVFVLAREVLMPVLETADGGASPPTPRPIVVCYPHLWGTPTSVR
jgi:hypothetical protein